MTSSQPSRRRVPTSRDIEVDGPAVLSMSDLRLAQCYQFIEETGVGNWGSVWLGRDKTSPDNRRVALKVVHRSTRSKTSGVRVRSLWNEMKIIRPLNSEQHPSIVTFNCFIITPSYAIIAMEYLPTLMQVEIDERKAKPWFASLASAIEWLHAHGVVHNDIKPANILLSEEGIPKLVDFGFAERYEPKGPNAFESQLAYGTPEYLCPERAKGNVHDTRKSDVWSLAITFFEILTGRTPFEREGEQFSTKEELETYWKRTVSGRWLDMKGERSKGRISPALEALLKRMLASNARVRLTAAEVCKDSYWTTPLPDPSSQEETPSKRRFSIFSELSSKSSTNGKSKTPSRKPLGGNKGPTPTATLTKATKATKASMASSLSLAVPRNVVLPEPRTVKENAPPSAFRRPNRGKPSRKPPSGAFGSQVQTAAVNFGDGDSSPNLLSQSQSSIFSLQQAVRNNRGVDQSRMFTWIESLEKTVEDTMNGFIKREPDALPPAPRDIGSNHSRQSSKNIFASLLEPDPPPSPVVETSEEQDGSGTETQAGKLGAYRPPRSISQDQDTFSTPKKRRATVTNIFSPDDVHQTGETRRAKSSTQLLGTITPQERPTPPSTGRASKRLSQIVNREEKDMFFSAPRRGAVSPALMTPEPSPSTPVDVVGSPFQGSNTNTISSNGTGMSSFYDRFLVSISDVQTHSQGLYDFDWEPRGDASVHNHNHNHNKSEVETQSGKKRASKFWASTLGKTQIGKGKSPARQDDAVDDFGSVYLHSTAASRNSGFGSAGTPTSERSSFSKSKVGGKKVQSSVRKAFNIFKNVGMSPATPSRPMF